MAVQVYEATKNGQGNPLSILNRQFISFSYGGKNIEDFDLLAVFNGDRLSKSVYTSFEDTTTNQAELDGQLFWRSKFNPLTLSFTLATDGITSTLLEDFKKWFRPSIEKELILSEYHNRAIMTRVASAPNMSLLPFEEDIEVEIGGKILKTKTTLYKGEITLEFVADEPFWYSKESLITPIFVEDENGAQVDTKLTPETLKIIYEDGIPYEPSYSISERYYCFFANGKYKAPIGITNITIASDLDIQQSNYYLYYCGSSMSKPILSFSIMPKIEEDTGRVSFPSKEINAKTYSLMIGNINFIFSLPSLLTSYNQALEIVNNFKGTSILELRKLLRDLFDYYTRSWVMGIIDTARQNNSLVNVNTGEIIGNFKEYFKNEMKRFLKPSTSIHFTFNSKTGEATLTTTINTFNSSNSSSTYTEIEENTGNMIKSEYLIIEPKNSIPKNGKVTVEDCYSISTTTILNDFKIDYNYMYL